MKKGVSKDELVNAFAGAAALHFKALLAGDHRKANREAREVFKAFDQLRRFGDQGREALMPLLRHEDKAVACSAAAVLLRYATGEATRVLEDLSRDRGLLGFQAQQALERWREGDWHLDE